MELIASQNYEACVAQGGKSMATYFEENAIPWDHDQRLSIYRNLELYEVIDQQSIGFIAFREADEAFYIADIQIFENFQNKGYGTRLIIEAKRIARARGYTRIFLKVFKSNPALGLYKRHGFTEAIEEPFVYVLESNT